jgi:YegS/Rv2252/BmrU family lipid kinase
MSKKKIVFIINPISGTGNFKKVEDAISKTLNHENFEPAIVYTKYKGHATEIAKEYSDKQFEYIVSVGGDGTLNEVVNGMIDSPSALGLIATGSGNGLARHLNISTNIHKAIEIINEEHVEKIDTVSLNDHRFISIAGIGFDAMVAHLFSLSKTRGFKTYAKIAFNQFFKYKSKKYNLQFPDKLKIKRAFFITFANSSQWGYNTKISPTASLTDGLVDVCIFKKPSLFKALFLLPYLFTNKIDKSHQVKIVKVPEVVITRPNGKKMHVHIDGDDSKKQKLVHIKVNPLSLKILTPKA